ncbi:hypothetical protein [Montanilutibacter psychrotolerans]|uniref:hypothetical protein n=1 Tax=Montanilutibacter psychrotolerans TaxID=1327343 RepID=UPI0011CD5B8F|nr:hypothetical protein [Lysobacter psychrotolerans]
MLQRAADCLVTGVAASLAPNATFNQPGVRMRLPILMLALIAGVSLPAIAAINPAEFQRRAPDQVRLRETARIVQDTRVGAAVLRRVTVVGEIVDEKHPAASRVGQSIVIDYRFDVTERQRAAKAYADAHGNRPGPQFMHEPDPPTLDAEGAFWANLAPADGDAGAAMRHAGAVESPGDTSYGGAVYVPVSGQYSFTPPND